MGQVRTALFISALVILGLVGSAAVVIGTRSLIVVWQSQSWPSAPAIVTKAWVVKMSMRYGYSYCPNWRYDYVVNNMLYRSELVAYEVSRCFSTEAAAVQALDEYPTGMKTHAYYNPARRDEAVLKISDDGWWIYVVITILGGLAAVLGFWNSLMLWRRPTRH